MIVAIHLRIDKLSSDQLEVLRAVLAPFEDGGEPLDLLVERIAGGQVAVWRAPRSPVLLGGEIPYYWPRSVALAPGASFPPTARSTGLE